MKPGFNWISETAGCCGLRFIRKHLPRRPFANPDKRCSVCGAELIWTKPNTKAMKNAWQQKLRAARVVAGLTIKGTPRKHTLHPELRGLTGKARRNAYEALRRAAFSKRGLTARGTPRKLVPIKLRAPSLAYAELKAEIAAAGPQPFPVATGFCEGASLFTQTLTAASRTFMANLITRTPESQIASPA